MNAVQSIAHNSIFLLLLLLLQYIPVAISAMQSPVLYSVYSLFDIVCGVPLICIIITGTCSSAIVESMAGSCRPPTQVQKTLMKIEKTVMEMDGEKVICIIATLVINDVEININCVHRSTDNRYKNIDYSDML